MLSSLLLAAVLALPLASGQASYAKYVTDLGYAKYQGILNGTFPYVSLPAHEV